LQQNKSVEDSLFFPVYDHDSLMFLNTDSEIGRKIQKSLVRADFDDDVATDDEM
jgi:hypothetical protein